MYRTGDLVEKLDSGDYVFVKRLDDQVKIDGFRIELAEIESVYCSNPLVEQAVVIVSDNKLVLYVKSNGGKELSAADKRSMHQSAERQLTHYMMPKYTVVVKAFPQTANGKLDRNALPKHCARDSNDSFFAVDTDDDEVSHVANAGDRSLADLICDVIAVVRGRRPKPTAYFTSLGASILLSLPFSLLNCAVPYCRRGFTRRCPIHTQSIRQSRWHIPRPC